MKQTTKPKDTTHLLKRDLARNVAALPLPTPPGGEGGEGGWSSILMDLQFPQFISIAVRRDEPLPLSLVTNHTSLITSYQSPITNLQTYDLIRVAAV
jgi:hypothetical protein